MYNPLNIGVIPARLGSQRLPNKPLALIGDKPLVQHVWESAKKAEGINRLLIATDSEKIAEISRGFGAEVVMTSPDHQNGSERTLEVLKKLDKELNFASATVIQGDLPFIKPSLITKVVDSLVKSGDEFAISTLAVPFESIEDFKASSKVKVLASASGAALYFSRSCIPHVRGEEFGMPKSASEILALKHIGIYCYRPKALASICALPASSLEKAESLEQLRALQNDFKILVVRVEHQDVEPAVEVDTEEDLRIANALYRT